MPPHAKGGGFSGSVGDPTAQNISRSAQSLSWRAFANTADAKERVRANLSGHDDGQKGSAFFWKIPFTTISREGHGNRLRSNPFRLPLRKFVLHPPLHQAR